MCKANFYSIDINNWIKVFDGVKYEKIISTAK